jgi:hypothetical protein
VKLLKLLIVPVVLLASAMMAVPVSAHQLSNATISVACGSGESTGRICVHLTGDIASDNQARFVFVDVFASGTNTSLGEVEFDLPAFNGTAPGCSNNHCDITLCFPAITGSSATSFDVKIMKVTSDSAGNMPSDLAFQFPNNVTVQFPRETPFKVATVDKCAAAPTPTPTPTAPATPTPTPSGGSGGGSPSPSASANTTVALAQTGGFDFRYPLIGLVLLVAGGALFVVSASRGRSSAAK